MTSDDCAGEGDPVAASGRPGGETEVAEEAGVSLRYIYIYIWIYIYIYIVRVPPLGRVEFQILHHFCGSFVDHR